MKEKERKKERKKGRKKEKREEEEGTSETRGRRPLSSPSNVPSVSSPIFARISSLPRNCDPPRPLWIDREPLYRLPQ